MKKTTDRVILIFWGIACGVVTYVAVTQDNSPQAVAYMAKASAMQATTVAQVAK